MDRLAEIIDPQELEVCCLRHSRLNLRKRKFTYIQVYDVLLQSISSLAHCSASIASSPLPGNIVYKIDQEVQNGLDAAAKVLQNQTVRQLFNPSDVNDTDLTIHVERDSSGRAVRAIVTIVSPTAQGFHNIGAQHTVINAGEAMPYIRLPEVERPTVADTVSLHKLSTEQEFAFRLIMKTMQGHIDKEQNIPQLTMSILGNAGEYLR